MLTDFCAPVKPSRVLQYKTYGMNLKGLDTKFAWEYPLALGRAN